MLMIKYVDRGWRDFGHLIEHEANRNNGDENIFAEVVRRASSYISHNIP